MSTTIEAWSDWIGWRAVTIAAERRMEHLAEDIAQRARVKALPALAAHEAGDIRPLLSTIIRRASADEARSVIGRRQAPGCDRVYPPRRPPAGTMVSYDYVDMWNDEEADMDRQSWRIDESIPRQDDVAEIEERRRWLRTWIEREPARTRSILEMHIGGVTGVEIARRVGVHEARVSQILHEFIHRARQAAERLEGAA